MTGNETREGAAPLADAIRLEAVGIDDWANVRSLHASAASRHAVHVLDPEQISAFRALAQTPEYTDALQREHLQAAWLNGHLIGTAGWTPTDDSGGAARITSVFVDPLFSRMGVGRLLVRRMEELAGTAGFAAFSTRATANAVAFFLALGYEISSYGVSSFGPDCELPVTFLRRALAQQGAAPTVAAISPEKARAAAVHARAMQVGQSWPAASATPRGSLKPRRR